MTTQTAQLQAHEHEVNPESKYSDKEMMGARENLEKIKNQIEKRLKKVMEEPEENKEEIRVINSIKKFQLYGSGKVGVMIETEELERMDSYGVWLIGKGQRIKSVNFRDHVVEVKISGR